MSHFESAQPADSHALSACAVTYYDDRTGTRHVIGLVHVALVSRGNPRGILTQRTDTVGITVSAIRDRHQLALGFNSSTDIIIPDDPDGASVVAVNGRVVCVSEGSSCVQRYVERGAQNVQ